MTCFTEKSTHRGKVDGKLRRCDILQKSPPTGEKSMGNCEDVTFYRKVHPQGKSRWETAKMRHFTEKSVHRGKVDGKLRRCDILRKSPPTGEKSMGNWENETFYGTVHAQGKSPWESGKMRHFTEMSTHRGKVDGKLRK